MTAKSTADLARRALVLWFRHVERAVRAVSRELRSRADCIVVALAWANAGILAAIIGVGSWQDRQRRGGGRYRLVLPLWPESTRTMNWSFVLLILVDLVGGAIALAL